MRGTIVMLRCGIYRGWQYSGTTAEFSAHLRTCCVPSGPARSPEARDS